ncbi:hypothetical protein B0H12DRAFT_1129928, partial [Mycena haematopus]
MLLTASGEPTSSTNTTSLTILKMNRPQMMTPRQRTVYGTPTLLWASHYDRQCGCAHCISGPQCPSSSLAAYPNDQCNTTSHLGSHRRSSSHPRRTWCSRLCSRSLSRSLSLTPQRGSCIRKAHSTHTKSGAIFTTIRDFWPNPRPQIPLPIITKAIMRVCFGRRSSSPKRGGLQLPQMKAANIASSIP